MQVYGAALPDRVLRNTFSFAILRNPIDRFRSAFDYLMQDDSFPQNVRFRKIHLSNIVDFGDLINRLENDRFRENVLKLHHFR